MMMNSQDLQKFIDEHHIQATILPLEAHTPTVIDAARALKVENDQIIKSLVFHIDGEPLLVINNGLARVERKKLAAYLHVGRKRVKFAAPDHVLEITGYIVGSMPPFGHKKKLRTVMDTAVARLDVIYGGGGDINAMMRLTPDELVKASQAEIAPVSG
jgi:Cys-tRNA(Pro) deacylase